MHDKSLAEAGRSEGRAVAIESRTKTYIGVADAVQTIKLRSLADIPGTLEEVARYIASGALDFKAGNAIVQAAGCAVGAIKAADDIAQRAAKSAQEMPDEALEEEIRRLLDKVMEERAMEMS